jgi:hypothetical protein
MLQISRGMRIVGWVALAGAALGLVVVVIGVTLFGGTTRDASEMTGAMRFVSIILLIGLMAFLFQLLLSWHGKIEQAPFFARIYKNAIRERENKIYEEPVYRKWDRRDYINELLGRLTARSNDWWKENPLKEPPERLQSIAKELDYLSKGEFTDYELYQMKERALTDLWWKAANIDLDPETDVQPTQALGSSGTGGLGVGRNRRPGGLPPGLGPSPRDETPKDIWEKKRQDYESLKDQYNIELETWQNDAIRIAFDWFSHDLSAARKEARENSQAAFSIDLSSIKGRGPEFILEFTAIVTIIFAATLLGLGRIMTNEQIGTLLAAIAGYVLGKGVARAQSVNETKTPEESNNEVKRSAKAEKTEDQGKR